MSIKFEELTELQKKLFSMDNQIELIKWASHLDDLYTSVKEYKKEQIIENIEKVKLREVGYYGETDLYLYDALKKYPINDKKVAILGSVKPWYESICLSYGGSPHTIEYNKIITDCQFINVSTVEEFKTNNIKFDYAFSISSFEHDGLGRYGDPVDPYGDIKAMKNVKENILNEGGILFLSVPVGVYKVVWNAHRIYGQKRLPLLLNGFNILDTFGFSEKDLEIDSGINVIKQPIWVLKNEKN